MKHISISLWMRLMLLALADVVVDSVGKFRFNHTIAAVRIVRLLDISPLRFFFALEEMTAGSGRVTSFSVCRETAEVRFATNTAAFVSKHFPQDQQIKSNLNQALADSLTLLLSGHCMSAHECRFVSQITVS